MFKSKILIGAVGVVIGGVIGIGEKVVVSIDNSYIANAMQKKATVKWCEKLEDNLWQTGLELDLNNEILFA